MLYVIRVPRVTSRGALFITRGPRDAFRSAMFVTRVALFITRGVLFVTRGGRGAGFRAARAGRFPQRSGTMRGMKFDRQARVWMTAVRCMAWMPLVWFVLLFLAFQPGAPSALAFLRAPGTMWITIAVVVGLTLPYYVSLHIWRQRLRFAGINACPECSARRPLDADVCPVCSAVHPAAENMQRWHTLLFKRPLLRWLPPCGPEAPPRSAAARWEQRGLIVFVVCVVLGLVLLQLFSRARSTFSGPVWMDLFRMLAPGAIPLLVYVGFLFVARRAARAVGPDCEYCGYAGVNTGGMTHCPECGNAATRTTAAAAP